jgi:hypothetical protein
MPDAKGNVRRAVRPGGAASRFAADALARVGGGAGAVCPRMRPSRIPPEDIFAKMKMGGGLG